MDGTYVVHASEVTLTVTADTLGVADRVAVDLPSIIKPALDHAVAALPWAGHAEASRTVSATPPPATAVPSQALGHLRERATEEVSAAYTTEVRARWCFGTAGLALYAGLLAGLRHRR